MSFWIQYPHLTFDEESHVYDWKGRRDYPSVTKPFDCIGFRKNDEKPFRPLGCPDEAKKEEYSTFGKAFHKITNIIMLGKEVVISNEERRKDAQPWIDQIKMFREEHPLIPIYDKNGNPIAEYPMFSELLKFFGTPDFFGRHEKRGEIWLPDWKSTMYYQKSFAWQTAGYEILIRELFGGELFDKREKIYRPTVLFHPSLKRAKIEPSTDPRDKIAFQSLLNTYRLAS